jgi:hypothetical protein
MRLPGLSLAGALVVLAAAGPAAGKGVRVDLGVSQASPRVGERVVVGLRATPELPVPRCRVMRVVAVAPGVPLQAALLALEARRVSRPVAAWGAFRLATLRRTGEWRWAGALRPGRPGRWTLVVPNLCADGLMLPVGLTRTTLDVRA